MACNLTQGFTLDCLDAIGGGLEVFLQNFDVFETGVTQDVTTEEIDALPTTTIFRYVPNRNSINFQQAPTNSPENGTSFVTQTLTFRVQGLDYDRRLEMNILKKAKVIAFVRLADDKILMLGRTQGMYMTAGTAGAGQARGDFAGFEITLSSDEPVFAYNLEDFTTEPFDNFAGITVSPAYGGS